MWTPDPASVLLGCLVGAVGVLVLTFLAAGIHVWWQGWREGGDELELPPLKKHEFVKAMTEKSTEK